MRCRAPSLDELRDLQRAAASRPHGPASGVVPEGTGGTRAPRRRRLRWTRAPPCSPWHGSGDASAASASAARRPTSRSCAGSASTAAAGSTPTSSRTRSRRATSCPGPRRRSSRSTARRASAGGRARVVGGARFIVPGLILILALAALFLAGSPPDWIRGAGAGAGAAVAAVAVQAGWSLLPTSRRRALSRLPLGALPRRRAPPRPRPSAPWLVARPARLRAIELAIRRGRCHRSRPLAARGDCRHAAASLSLSWVALKVGALSYGGGFVIIPLMQGDAVDRYHWMTAGQFLNAVALGQITPGPVVHTVAVVGYAAAGLGGGLLAALVAFSPSFVFILLGGERFDRLRANAAAPAFLAGAGPAAIGAILGVGRPAHPGALVHWQYAVLALAALALRAQARRRADAAPRRSGRRRDRPCGGSAGAVPALAPESRRVIVGDSSATSTSAGAAGPSSFSTQPGFTPTSGCPMRRRLRGRCRVLCLDQRGHGDSDRAGHRLSLGRVRPRPGRVPRHAARPARRRRRRALHGRYRHRRRRGFRHPPPRDAALLDLVLIPGAPTKSRRTTSASGARKRREVWESREEMFAVLRTKGAFATWKRKFVRLDVDHGVADRPDGQVELRCPRDVEGDDLRPGGAEQRLRVPRAAGRADAAHSRRRQSFRCPTCSGGGDAPLPRRAPPQRRALGRRRSVGAGDGRDRGLLALGRPGSGELPGASREPLRYD